LPVESLGYGGLGIGWGLGCWQWSPSELTSAGLNAAIIQQAYSTVAQRIGISAAKDDAHEYTIGNLEHYQHPLEIDRNGRLLYSKYLKNKKSLAKEGFVMGRAPLALITQDSGQRKAYAYRDLDFYSDNEHSAWRPWMTVDHLKKHKSFNYIGDQLVLS